MAAAGAFSVPLVSPATKHSLNRSMRLMFADVGPNWRTVVIVRLPREIGGSGIGKRSQVLCEAGP